MITNYEVGSVFIVEDRATAVLNEIADYIELVAKAAKEAQGAMEEFGRVSGIGALTEQLKYLNDGMTLVRQGAAEMAEQYAGDVDGMAEVTGQAANNIFDQFAGAFAKTTEASEQMAAYVIKDAENIASGVAAAAARAGSAGGGMGRSVAGGAAGAAAGGHGGGGLVSGMLPFAEAAGIYESMKSGMSEDMSIRQSLLAMQLPSTDANMSRMREMAAAGAKGTVFSEAQTAGAMPTFAQEAGFTGEGAIDKMGSIFRTSLQSAEVSQMLHLGKLDDTTSANIEYAHMTRRYEPKDLEQGLDTLMKVSQSIHLSPHATESILKYSVPIGMAAGINPDDAAIATGFLARSGFKGSTSGTGFAALLLGALQTGGGIGAHLEGAKGELESALKGTPEKVDMKGSAHTKALAALGITDGVGGKLNIVDDKGNVVMAKLFADIEQYAATHQKQDTLDTMHNAFGTRGERVAVPFMDPKAAQYYGDYSKMIHSGAGANAIQTELANAPEQQFEQFLKRAADIGNTLATATLPALNTAFGILAGLLGGINDYLKAHPTVAGVAGGAAGIAGTLGVLGMAKGLWGRLFGGFAGAAEGGAATAGGTGIGSILGAILKSPLGMVGTGMAVAGSGGYAIGENAAKHNSKNMQSYVDWVNRNFGDDFTVAPPPPVPGAKGGANPLLHKEAYHPGEDDFGGGGSGITVHIDQVIIEGMTASDPHEFMDKMMHHIGRNLSIAQTHNLGSGAGTYSSGYTSGRDI